MAAGPGKYDHLCTQARKAASARACVVLIGGGNRGNGFDVQIAAETAAEFVELSTMLADALRQAADQIQADARRMRQKIAAGESLAEYGGYAGAPIDPNSKPDPRGGAA